MGDQQALHTILNSLAPYRIDENKIVLTQTVLGRGAFGLVFLGEMGLTLVAVKQLHATGTSAENKKLALALAQELHVWAGLAHPNVVPLVGFFLDEGLERAWFVSSYMKNGNICNYLKKHNPDMVVRLRMWGEIARGIAYLHSCNLCHGDIKGANALVDDDGHAKICDFGLTKLMENGTAGGTSTGLKGTIRYMAPEFFHNQSTRNKKTDVWAWSCLGSEILFDQIPYDSIKIEVAVMSLIVRGKPPLDLDTIFVDEDIRQLLKRCWVSNPNDRSDIKACATTVERVSERARLAVSTDELSSTVSHVAGFRPPPASREASSEVCEPNRLIEHWRWSLLSRPEGHAERHDNLDGLGVSLLFKYRKQSDVASLHEAIDMLRHALLLRPVNHPERHNSLQNLGVALTDKYRIQGDVAALSEAVDMFRRALLLRPVGHPERSITLYAFGASLMDKYAREGQFADLHEALDILHQALQLRPVGHPERPMSLYSCGRALRSKFNHEGDSADLSEAITLYRQAMALLAIDDQLRPSMEAAIKEMVAEQLKVVAD